MAIALILYSEVAMIPLFEWDTNCSRTHTRLTATPPEEQEGGANPSEHDDWVRIDIAPARGPSRGRTAVMGQGLRRKESYRNA